MHSRLPVLLRALGVIALLYLFLVGVSLLEAGIEGLGSNIQEQLFSRVSNPIAGLFVGILATVLVQSSSVTTSTIVGLVATGLLSVGDAVPMVMGANIGTSVTNTLASMGSISRPEEFRRATAAATVHDFFNVLSVIVLLPLELATGFLATSGAAISGLFTGAGGSTFKSPFKTIVKAPVGVLEDLVGAVFGAGTLLGILLIVLGLAAIFAALTLTTKSMRTLIADQLEQSINRVLEGGSGLVALALGMIVTIAVQSSSITTSILVPLAVTLRNISPVTLGANVGTTITALLASLATDRPEALTVALVHTLFNLSGIAIFYGIPVLRQVPLRLASGLGDLAVRERGWFWSSCGDRATTASNRSDGRSPGCWWTHATPSTRP